MESGTSYRKRFLWQIADSELKSIQVAIKRRNLKNPIKSTAPLIRIFDPELHTLIVHLTGPNAGRENSGGLSIFDKPGVMCNKEATPDRTLEKERQPEESISSDDSEVASPRIYRKNSNPKCCRDLFLRDELMKKNPTKHNNKNRTSKERGNRSSSNKNRDSRPSTSGYNKSRTELSRNDPRQRKSRSNTPQSTGSVDLPPNVYDTQRGHTESSRKEKHNQRSDGVDQYTSGSTHSARYNKNSRQPQYTATDDHQYHHQQQQSPRQRYRRSRSRSTRSRSGGSQSSSRYYRNSRESNAKHHRFKSIDRHDRSRSRSKSINERRTSRSKSTKRSTSRRSLTPLRPGEYRPGKRKRLSPQSRSREDTVGGQRSNQRGRLPDANMPIMQPFDYPPMAMPYHQYGDYGAIFPGPRAAPMRYPTGGVPRAPPMLAPPHHYAPYIQYVPVTALAPPPHGRPAHLYPAHYQQPPRPNKVYNSRHIPQFQGGVTVVGAVDTNSGNTGLGNEAGSDRFSVAANVDQDSVTIQLEEALDSVNHENPTSTSISTPVISANLTPEQLVEADTDRLTLNATAEDITVEEQNSPL